MSVRSLPQDTPLKVAFRAAVLSPNSLSKREVAMENVVDVVEVQELTLAELAQVSGGFGDASFV
jgi:hypothetical protein